jgi:acyl carrier protein
LSVAGIESGQGGPNMQSDVEHRLRRFIGKHFLAQEEPWPGPEHASLRDSGAILDDTEVIELIELLEKTFGIVVLDDEIHPKNLDTIHALATYVDRKLAQSPASVASIKPWSGLRRWRTELAAWTAIAISGHQLAAKRKVSRATPL